MRGVSEHVAAVARVLLPLALTAALLALALVMAGAVVVYAIVEDFYRSVAVSLVCVPTLAVTIFCALLYVVTVREMVYRSAPVVREVERSVAHSLPAARQTIDQPGQLVALGDGVMVDISTTERLANAIELALRPRVKPTQMAIKARIPEIRDNNRITEAMHELHRRGVVYTTGDGRTASYEWIDSPSPTGWTGGKGAQ